MVNSYRKKKNSLHAHITTICDNHKDVVDEEIKALARGINLFPGFWKYLLVLRHMGTA